MGLGSGIAVFLGTYTDTRRLGRRPILDIVNIPGFHLIETRFVVGLIVGHRLHCSASRYSAIRGNQVLRVAVDNADKVSDPRLLVPARIPLGLWYLILKIDLLAEPDDHVLDLVLCNKFVTGPTVLVHSELGDDVGGPHNQPLDQCRVVRRLCLHLSWPRGGV